MEVKRCHHHDFRRHFTHKICMTLRWSRGRHNRTECACNSLAQSQTLGRRMSQGAAGKYGYANRWCCENVHNNIRGNKMQVDRPRILFAASTQTTLLNINAVGCCLNFCYQWELKVSSLHKQSRTATTHLHVIFCMYNRPRGRFALEECCV